MVKFRVNINRAFRVWNKLILLIYY